MKIKKLNISYVLLLSSLLISLFSYEVHLFKFYKITQFLSSGFLVVHLLLYLKNEKAKHWLLRQNKQFLTLIVMFFLMVSNTIMGYIYYGYNTVISILNVIVLFITCVELFYVIPNLILSDINFKKILKKTILLFGFLLATFSCLLHFNGNKLFGYTLENYRNASFYYDPNFCATMLGSMFIIISILEYKKILKILLLCLFGFAIYLTGSRGALLSIIVAYCLYFLIFSKIKLHKKILLSIILAISIYYVFQFLYNSNYFRLYQGDNARSLMSIYAVRMAFKSPIFGYGYQAIRGALVDVTGLASTHNSYIDYLFGYGVPTFLLYFIFLSCIMLKSIKYIVGKKRKLIILALFMLINANSILYSFGGVGGVSYIFTVLLGVLNLYAKNFKNKKQANENGGLNED